MIAGVIYLQYTSRPTVQFAGSAVVSFIRFVDQVHRFALRTLSVQHLLRHVRAAAELTLCRSCRHAANVRLGQP